MAVAREQEIVESEDVFESGGQLVHAESFAPGKKKRAPVLLLHGVDGLERRAAEYRDMARRLARHGFAAFLIHYFERTDTRPGAIPMDPRLFLAWMESISDAMTALCGHEGVTGKCGLVGVSLGAYLALAAASQDERVGAVVECFGGLHDLFRGNAARLPPVLILHGAHDPVVPVTEARRLARLLGENNVPHESKIYPNAGHRFVGADYEDAMERAVRFLRERLPLRAREGGGA